MHQLRGADGETGIPRIVYRALPPVLNDGKIVAHQALATTQDELHRDHTSRAEDLESLLARQEKDLQALLASHRHGFERPAATLALYTPRPEKQEALHSEWLGHMIKYHEAELQFRRHYGNESAHFAAARTAMEKKERIKEMKGTVMKLQDQLIERAADLPQHADAEHVDVDEMRHRQKAMAQQVRAFQANSEAEFARERARNAELRTQSILQMQQQQRALRNQMQMEKDHERLRISNLTARAKEQRRALNVGSPPWLQKLTPGLGEEPF